MSNSRTEVFPSSLNRGLVKRKCNVQEREGKLQSGWVLCLSVCSWRASGSGQGSIKLEDIQFSWLICTIGCQLIYFDNSQYLCTLG